MLTSLLSTFTHAQNASVEIRGRYLLNFSRETKAYLIIFWQFVLESVSYLEKNGMFFSSFHPYHPY